MTPEPVEIFTPDFWRRRRDEAATAGQSHHAVFKTTKEKWAAIEAAHRQILAAKIAPAASILDVGCGWGRLLDLLPPMWRGRYLGVDLSPDFVAQAASARRGGQFLLHDMREPPNASWGTFEWAILVSVRPMIRRHAGDEVWQTIEANVRRAARRLLYLEYDPLDPGAIE